MPVRVDTPIWLSTQVAPDRLMVQHSIRPQICPGPEVWRVPFGPELCEFQGGALPCRPPLGAGETGDWLPTPSEGSVQRPYIVLRCIPKLALPEDVLAVEKEMEQLAKELRQKRMTLGYSQADVGFAVGALFGKVLSQTTICRFEAQQLSLAKMWKLRPLLKMWLEEVDTKNLVGVCKMEMILQQARKWRRASRERRIGNNLEKHFRQCPRPTPQQLSSIAGRLGLQKDLVQLWFYNRAKMGSRPTSDSPPPQKAGPAALPLSGEPVYFPLAPGLQFGAFHHGGPNFNPPPPSLSLRGDHFSLFQAPV